MRPETQRWLVMADEEMSVAALLQEAGWRSAAVFHLHLTVEKTLKALVCESNGTAGVPYSHNLPHLAQLCGFEITNSSMEFLGKLSPHGVAARYATSPDIYPAAFCEELLKGAEEFMRWSRQQLT